MKEFNLSEKIRRYIHEVTGKELRETLEVEDVKEFIKRLKKEWARDVDCDFRKKIDKLAGEKLR